MLPTSKQISTWSDSKLINVYNLLIFENVSPELENDSKDSVDDYVENVVSEYKERFGIK